MRPRRVEIPIPAHLLISDMIVNLYQQGFSLARVASE